MSEMPDPRRPRCYACGADSMGNPLRNVGAEIGGGPAWHCANGERCRERQASAMPRRNAPGTEAEWLRRLRECSQEGLAPRLRDAAALLREYDALTARLATAERERDEARRELEGVEKSEAEMLQESMQADRERDEARQQLAQVTTMRQVECAILGKVAASLDPERREGEELYQTADRLLAELAALRAQPPATSAPVGEDACEGCRELHAELDAWRAGARFVLELSRKHPRPPAESEATQ